MTQKKKKRRRKTFNLPKDGPLYETDDDWVAMSPDGMHDESLGQQEAPMPTEEELRGQQLEMIRNVFAFEKLAWRGFRAILFSILFFSVGASLAGGVLGWTCPEYCRYVFDAFDRVDFQPWIGGLAHGLAVGAFAGAVIGCVVVLSVALYQSRSWKNLQERDQQS